MHSSSDAHQPISDDDKNYKEDVQKLLSARVPDSKQFAATIYIDKQHADNFGRLAVQNIDGRIEPVNTLALEILRKLFNKDSFHSLNANQFLLSVSTIPFKWVNVPLIKVGSKGGQNLLKMVKTNLEGYTSMINILKLGSDGSLEFLLKGEYLKSFSKRLADRNNYDKDIIELNNRAQVMLQLIYDRYLRIFPIAGDVNNTSLAMPTALRGVDVNHHNTIDHYFKAVKDAQKSGNWIDAEASLNHIRDLQNKYGAQIIPSQKKLNLEVNYNSWNIFLNLMITYALLGVLILGIALLKLFKSLRVLNKIATFVLILIIVAGMFQAVGLGVRWYISGHEPWSNGYEAALFISWIGVLAGLLIYRNRNAFIPAAGCLIAVILLGFAHGGSQMNPQITPLVPVLKSYWLMIHVAIITSSYGFFWLSALLGTVVLLLYIINNNKIDTKVKASMTELTLVNEMSLTAGLFLLTVGTFLGGVWTNESLGRYWSWDPKETWAFISVIIYAFVLHIRLIPSLQGKYLFNLFSLLSFSTIIMTYFGVNYYLSGLHSYAKGDPVPIPLWMYITLAFVFILVTLSYYSYKTQKHKKQNI